MCWMSLHLLHFSISMILIISQSSSLICDPVAAVIKSATRTHTAASLKNSGEVAITISLCLPVLLGWTCSSIVTVGYSPPFQTVVAAPEQQISCFFFFFLVP